MQIPILSGIYADEVADYRTSYPVNMVPVPKGTGISSGYLRTAEGATKLGPGPGYPRGGINWNGECYRVMGTSLIKVNSSGGYTVLGDVGDVSISGGKEIGRQCSFDYSFDRLAIASGGRLYYWDGAALTKVSDPDIGLCLSVKWVDGYFMSTDGTSLIVTELSDPLSVNSLKYGSSEIDPDPIKLIVKLRNEIHAVNRYTIEVFDNVGGDLFPFERIGGAQIQKGAIGSNAACVYGDFVAFLGSGRNEPPGIYLGSNASIVKISTREIDDLLSSYRLEYLENAILESRSNLSSNHLWVRLPDRTIVYDLSASQAVGEPVWFYLTTSNNSFEQYKIVDPVWCYDMWLVADSETGDLGYLDLSTARHFGRVARWEFATAIIYNDSRGVIFNTLELSCLAGRVEENEDPVISTSYTVDGMTWSQNRSVKVGVRGDRNRRIVWFQQGKMSSWRVQRFIGDSRALLSIARLEATIEPLYV